MLVTLHESRPIPTLEEVPDALVPTVESLGVDAVQAMHPLGEICLRRLNEEVVVVPQKAIGQETPAETHADIGEDFEKTSAVADVFVD